MSIVFGFPGKVNPFVTVLSPRPENMQAPYHGDSDKCLSRFMSKKCCLHYMFQVFCHCEPVRLSGVAIPRSEGKCTEKYPKTGIISLFGCNHYLVPFNWGIATPVCALARNDSIFSNAKQQFGRYAQAAMHFLIDHFFLSGGHTRLDENVVRFYNNGSKPERSRKWISKQYGRGFSAPIP